MANDPIPITEEKIELFLNVISQIPNKEEASKITAISRRRWERYRRKNPDFAKRFDAAWEQSLDLLESEAHRRAFEGVQRVKWYQGKPIGYEVEYSDRLLERLLEAYRPEVFAKRTHAEITGKGGKPLIPENPNMMETARRIAFILNAGVIEGSATDITNDISEIESTKK